MNLIKGTKIVCIKTLSQNYKNTGIKQFYLKDKIYTVHEITKEGRIVVMSEVKSTIVGFVFREMWHLEFEEHFITLAKYREQQLNEILE